VRKQLAKGVGILKVAKSLGIGTGTVQRISGERQVTRLRFLFCSLRACNKIQYAILIRDVALQVVAVKLDQIKGVEEDAPVIAPPVFREPATAASRVAA